MDDSMNIASNKGQALRVLSRLGALNPPKGLFAPTSISMGPFSQISLSARSCTGNPKGTKNVKTQN